MKLYSFTTVKDEEDVIESFVRYNMNILDGMVISDNGSTDDTLDILYKLKKEGYNIDIIEDDQPFREQDTKNRLLKYTVNKYKPDIIFPLDADEFIATTKGCNPREIIEELQHDRIYLYNMEHYVLTSDDISDNQFIPDRITHIRKLSSNYNYYKKCFIPIEVFNKSEMILAMGGHDADYVNGEEIKKEKLNDLFLAHYPVRSVAQYTNKAINHGLNTLMIYDSKSGINYHLFYMFERLIELGYIPDNEIFEYSKYYDLLDKTNKYKSKKQYLLSLTDAKLNYDFCKKIEIKYTEQPSLENVLKKVLFLSKSIIDEMREKYEKLFNDTQIMDRYRNEIDSLKKENNSLRNELSIKQKEYLELSNKHNKVINSKWWRLRKYLLFWKKK